MTINVSGKISSRKVSEKASLKTKTSFTQFIRGSLKRPSVSKTNYQWNIEKGRPSVEKVRRKGKRGNSTLIFCTAISNLFLFLLEFFFFPQLSLTRKTHSRFFSSFAWKNVHNRQFTSRKKKKINSKLTVTFLPLKTRSGLK